METNNLTSAQLDGVACLVCAGEDGAMRPAGSVNGAQVFQHPACAETPEVDVHECPEGGCIRLQGHRARHRDADGRSWDSTVEEDGPCALGWSHVGECVDRGTAVGRILLAIDARVEVRRREVSAMVDAILADIDVRAEALA